MASSSDEEYEQDDATVKEEYVKQGDFSTKETSLKNTKEGRTDKESFPRNSFEKTSRSHYPSKNPSNDVIGKQLMTTLLPGKEGKENASTSKSLGWRDRDYKYERSTQNRTDSYSNCTSMENWKSKDSSHVQTGTRSSSRVNERSFSKGNACPSSSNRNLNMSPNDYWDYAHHQPTSRKTSPVGCWSFACASYTLLENGLTEVDHVWNVVKEFYDQNRDMFARSPNQFILRQTVLINCYTHDYEDKCQVAKVANALIEKIHNFSFFIFYNYSKKLLYMRTFDGDFYESTECGWKISNFKHTSLE